MSVCLSVGHTREPCKNGWTDRVADSRVDSGGPKERCVGWRTCGPDSQREGAFLGVFRPIEKHYESLLHCMLQKNNNCITAPLLQRTAMLSSDQCHIRLSPTWKICLLRCGLLSKFFDHVWKISVCWRGYCIPSVIDTVPVSCSTPLCLCCTVRRAVWFVRHASGHGVEMPSTVPGSGRVENVRYGLLGLALTTTTSRHAHRHADRNISYTSRGRNKNHEIAISQPWSDRSPLNLAHLRTYSEQPPTVKTSNCWKSKMADSRHF